MSSFEQNIENILDQLNSSAFYDGHDHCEVEYCDAEPMPVSEELKAALVQAHQDDLLAVIGEDETEFLNGQDIGPGDLQEVRNQLRAEQRTHLTQETGND